jgi:hypothetical protein
MYGIIMWCNHNCLVTFFVPFFFLTYVGLNFQVIAVGYAIMTTRSMDLNWKMRALRVLPMFLLPGVSSVAYSAFVSFTRMCKFLLSIACSLAHNFISNLISQNLCLLHVVVFIYLTTPVLPMDDFSSPPNSLI